MTKSEVKEVTKELKINTKSDVLVVGAGPAGLAASIASARHGADTILLERHGTIGGMGGVALVGPYMTCYDTEGNNQIVRGIFQELVDRMVEKGGAIHPSKVEAGSEYVSFIGPGHHNATPFDPEVMKYVAMEMLMEAGVKVKLHTFFADCLVEQNNIRYSILADKKGLSLAEAKVFIDTTGDGDLAASAGVPFDKGRSKDGKLQPATMFMIINNVNDKAVIEWKKEHPNERLFQSLVRKAKENGDFPEDCPRKHVGLYKMPRRGHWRVNTSRVLGVDGTDPESLTTAEVKGRRQAHKLIKFFNDYCPGLGEAQLLTTGCQVGIRETRRIRGQYKLTKDDVRKGKKFEDTIARYAYYMDVHNPSGTGQESERVFVEDEPFFEVPYRALIPLDIDNLLIGGRCISADRPANGAIREMPACSATGQAAGTAASLSVGMGNLPRNLDKSDLRATLREDGCFV